MFENVELNLDELIGQQAANIADFREDSGGYAIWLEELFQSITVLSCSRSPQDFRVEPFNIHFSEDALYSKDLLAPLVDWNSNSDQRNSDQFRDTFGKNIADMLSTGKETTEYMWWMANVLFSPNSWKEISGLSPTKRRVSVQQMHNVLLKAVNGGKIGNTPNSVKIAPQLKFLYLNLFCACSDRRLWDSVIANLASGRFEAPEQILAALKLLRLFINQFAAEPINVEQLDNNLDNNKEDIQHCLKYAPNSFAAIKSEICSLFEIGTDKNENSKFKIAKSQKFANSSNKLNKVLEDA